MARSFEDPGPGGGVFADRAEAGRRLAGLFAERCAERPGRYEPAAVFGLPRGGVPVAGEVARELGAPLDVILVRKLGVPAQPELAMGALGEGGVEVLDRDLVERAGVSERQLDAVRAQEHAELDRRVARYRGGRPRVEPGGRTAVVVDDGIATGATARAACRVARAQGARRVVLAVPVAPRGWRDWMADAADELECVREAGDFFGIGQFYADFHQTSDAEVLVCLAAADRRSR